MRASESEENGLCMHITRHTAIQPNRVCSTTVVWSYIHIMLILPKTKHMLKIRFLLLKDALKIFYDRPTDGLGKTVMACLSASKPIRLNNGGTNEENREGNRRMKNEKHEILSNNVAK